jgi:hypothetical protein
LHGVIWLIFPLVFVFGMRGWGGRGRRGGRERRGPAPDRESAEYVAHLEGIVEAQQGQIEALEARVARVEEGLDFAERVLAERASARIST